MHTIGHVIVDWELKDCIVLYCVVLYCMVYMPPCQYFL